MILVLDNYDSFTYNLVHSIYENEEIKVIRNDELKPEEVEDLSPRVLIISPGPGKPVDAGYTEDFIRYFKNKIPILGICLGHQAIGEVFGGTVRKANKVMHGQKDLITIYEDPIFKGFENKINVGRYHSLVVDKDTLPDCFKVIALADDGELMGIKHKEYPIWGLQFHPESIMTEDGIRILKNFLEINND